MFRTAVLSALVAVMTVGALTAPQERTTPGVRLASVCSDAAVAVSDFQTYEGTGSGVRTFSFLVTATPAPGCVPTGSVQVNTLDGTAAAPSDYQPASTTISWSGSSTPQAFTVSAIADQAAEPDEYFRVALSNPVGVVITRPIGVGTVLDDDDPPQRTGVDGGKICWGIDTAQTDHATQSDVCPVPVRTNYPPLVPITVRFRTIAPTGKAIGYEPVVDGLVTIPAGRTTGYADIRLRPGPRPAEERFIIELSSPSAGVLSTSRAEVVIRSR